MTSRFIALFACGLSLAVACGSDDDKKDPPVDDAGGAPSDAGAPPVSAGSSSTPGGSGGSGGRGGSGGSGGTGGGLTSPGGMAGETSSAGAASDGGTPSTDCPSPPSQTTLNCQSYTRGYFNNNDLILEVSFGQVPFQMPAGGMATISWEDQLGETLPGSAEVPWTYSPSSRQFDFQLPIEARYATYWVLSGWSFMDACGSTFSAPNLVIDYDGEAFNCGQPT